MAKKKITNNQQFLSPERYLREKARTLEIGKCYVSSDIREAGEGMVIVQRLHKGVKITFGAFLVDIFCLGVVDAFAQVRVDEEDFSYNFGSKIESGELVEIPYAEAHNWVYGAIEFAAEAGVNAPKQFDLAGCVLEEDDERVPLIDLPFGKEGKHFLVADSQEMVDRLLPYLEEHLGEDVKFVVPV